MISLNFLISSAYAMGPPPGGAGGADAGNPLTAFLPLILIFGIFYFLLIRPQQKRQKEHKALLSNLKRGDTVVTSGGILGEITKVEEKFITVEVAEKVRIKIARGQIMSVINEED
jgi:preprotein translocase subunit YajC